MASGKTTGILIGVATIFPFVADHMGWWAAVLGTGQLASTVLVVYTAALIIAVATLLIRTPVLEKREKWQWTIGLVLAFPFVTLALMYRLYWNPPVAGVAK